jgi:hypothetical protein
MEPLRRAVYSEKTEAVSSQEKDLEHWQREDQIGALGVKSQRHRENAPTPQRGGIVVGIHTAPRSRVRAPASPQVLDHPGLSRSDIKAGCSVLLVEDRL